MELNLNRWHAMMPKRTMAEKALGKSLKYIGQNPDKNAWYAMKAIDLLTTGEKQGLVREWLHHWMREDDPAVADHHDQAGKKPACMQGFIEKTTRLPLPSIITQ